MDLKLAVLGTKEQRLTVWGCSLLKLEALKASQLNSWILHQEQHFSHHELCNNVYKQKLETPYLIVPQFSLANGISKLLPELMEPILAEEAQASCNLRIELSIANGAEGKR